jgi:hypothetical protein
MDALSQWGTVSALNDTVATCPSFDHCKSRSEWVSVCSGACMGRDQLLPVGEFQRCLGILSERGLVYPALLLMICGPCCLVPCLLHPLRCHLHSLPRFGDQVPEQCRGTWPRVRGGQGWGCSQGAKAFARGWHSPLAAPAHCLLVSPPPPATARAL